MPYLEDLSVKGQIPESVLRQLLESSAETLDLPRFNTLSKVEITVGVPALSLLRPTFSAMTSLTLDILMEKESHELDALAHLPLERTSIPAQCEESAKSFYPAQALESDDNDAKPHNI
ncbi:hypothetical protein D6D11_09536 [Aureobasidium pullulans]|nr:hypothetical protein D6D11_09536 [Aureobasidium pullulans]